MYLFQIFQKIGIRANIYGSKWLLLGLLTWIFFFFLRACNNLEIEIDRHKIIIIKIIIIIIIMMMMMMMMMMIMIIIIMIMIIIIMMKIC